MPFNMLIATCLLAKTDVTENSVRIYCENTQDNEKILFFKIDHSKAKTSEIKPGFYDHFFTKGKEAKCTGSVPTRKKGVFPLESQESNKICDLLIYYNQINNKKSVFCLTELTASPKKEDFEYSLSQICNAFRKCRHGFTHAYPHSKEIIWAGFICRNGGSAPTYNDQDIVDKFKNENGDCKQLDLRICSIHEANITKPHFSCDIKDYLVMIYNHDMKKKTSKK